MAELADALVSGTGEVVTAYDDRKRGKIGTLLLLPFSVQGFLRGFGLTNLQTLCAES